MHAIENAKVAAPAPPPAVALQTQLQLQLPGPGPGPRPRPRDINKTRQLRIAAILVSMSSVEGVCPIWGLNNARGREGFMRFRLPNKSGLVWSGLPWICWIGCAFVHRTADAASRTRALPLLFIESAWTTDDKNKTFKCA